MKPLMPLFEAFLPFDDYLKQTHESIEKVFASWNDFGTMEIWRIRDRVHYCLLWERYNESTMEEMR